MPRPAWALGAVVALALTFAVRLWMMSQTFFPWDFAIDWTAAYGVKSSVSLYDRTTHDILSAALIDGRPDELFRSEFANFTHLPPAILFILPFAGLPFATALVAYRWTLALVFVLTIFVAGFALPSEYRKRGWLIGVVSLLTLNSTVRSIVLGQFDAWIAFALAVAIWTASRARWGLVGIGVSVAATLKVSPGLLLGYCLLRRKWRALFAAAATGLAVLILAALLDQPRDIIDWIFKEAPRLGSLGPEIDNKSLAGSLARLFLFDTPFPAEFAGLGPLKVLSPLLAVALLGLVWQRARGREARPIDLGVLILVALLVGPVSWDHYAAWSIVFLVLLADARLWANRSMRR